MVGCLLLNHMQAKARHLRENSSRKSQGLPPWRFTDHTCSSSAHVPSVLNLSCLCFASCAFFWTLDTFCDGRVAEPSGKYLGMPLGGTKAFIPDQRDDRKGFASEHAALALTWSQHRSPRPWPFLCTGTGQVHVLWPQGTSEAPEGASWVGK